MVNKKQVKTHPPQHGFGPPSHWNPTNELPREPNVNLKKKMKYKHENPFELIKIRSY